MKVFTPQAAAAKYVLGHSWAYVGTEIDDAIDDARRVFWPEDPFTEWDEVEEARKAGMSL